MQHGSLLGGEISEQSMPISPLRVVGASTSLVENTMNGNKCISPVEIGAVTNSENTRRFVKKETVRRIKSIVGHVGLLITLMLYTAIGGLVFRQIELPAELRRLERLRAKLRTQRYHFVESISNNTDVFNLHTLVSVKLRAYEEAVQEAAEAGLLVSFVTDIIDRNDYSELPPIVTERWNVFQAVFFASTVLTTIGYGNVVPSTNWGRIFCILFAFVGIPLTLIVIADWGKIIASVVVHIGLMMKSKLPFRAKLSCIIPTNVAGRRSLGACAAIVLLFLYLACGAGMFMLWEDDWNFFDGFYFCFVTMTTIGFGDLVPKKPKYTLLCTLYILVGLALTSTIIELVRRQYAQSWRRLQRLSGPLAETLRKLGEQAGDDMSALHSDLRYTHIFKRYNLRVKEKL
ncbi:TWiK family of potassium channels protein 7 isoform X2 [Solenopsis invicta]|uniref:TWiK family of potassium channels protein 7 isoform X2 n=1 Tax=Solenopsis invicta TaxID=13686 RepID=UPI00193D6868|nr:TWiK family of potassium channels protein 7 isoform X2 [Solenopsis invicta]